jgi:hypothetical protein
MVSSDRRALSGIQWSGWPGNFWGAEHGVVAQLFIAFAAKLLRIEMEI